MRDAVICEPLRTPVGRFGGVFADVPASSLAKTVIEAVIDRTGLPGRRDRRRAARPVLRKRRGTTSMAASRRSTPACPSPRPGLLRSTAAADPGLQAGDLDASMRVQTGAPPTSCSRAAPRAAEPNGALLGQAPLRRAQAARCRRPPRALRVTAGGLANHPVPGGMLEDRAENLRREAGPPCRAG